MLFHVPLVGLTDVRSYDLFCRAKPFLHGVKFGIQRNAFLVDARPYFLQF